MRLMTTMAMLALGGAMLGGCALLEDGADSTAYSNDVLGRPTASGQTYTYNQPYGLQGSQQNGRWMIVTRPDGRQERVWVSNQQSYNRHSGGHWDTVTHPDGSQERVWNPGGR